MRKRIAGNLCEFVLWLFGQPITKLVLMAWDGGGVLWGIHAPMWEPDPLPVAVKVRSQLQGGRYVELPHGWRLTQLDQSRD